MSRTGRHEVGKGSWKDREVGKFEIGKNFLTSRPSNKKQELGNLSN